MLITGVLFNNMLLNRYKVSLPSEDTGSRFWIYLIYMACGFYFGLGLVDLFDSYWFLLVGILMSGISSASINISGLRVPYYIVWTSLLCLGPISVLIQIFYFKTELESSPNLFILMLFSFIALVQLLMGLIFFKRYKTAA
ncbi:MAG: hypothetical protein COB38_08325 [Gammaproteobacteria bacterium]|nr:MAG: hypothetical protein COB38_08325 [Gammaproteobacteria bacterium]